MILLREMIVGCAAASAIAASASAGVFDFNPPNETGSLGSDLGSDDRGVQVLMLSTFTISSAQIMVDPRLGQSFDLILTIYNSDESYNRGSMFATARANHDDSGIGLYGVNINALLRSGSYYEIAFDVVGGWGHGDFDMELFRFHAPGDDPFDVGPFRVRDGLFGANPVNTVMPYISVLPAPGTLALAGLAAVFARRRRRD